MPLIPSSDYKPPRWLFNGHLQTIVPSQFRKVGGLMYQRERLPTADQDFLLLDWAKVSSKKLAIISHGLEGDSERPYIKGMVRAFNRAGYDALAWNFRGCGGEINHTLRFYHSGATDDLDFVFHHAVSQKHYQQVVLIGFSLGGNLTLKYLGEKGKDIHPLISKAAVFSVPIDLHSCATQIDLPGNFIYSQRFLYNLKKKVRMKELSMPENISSKFFHQIKSLKDFDDIYTAPLHGFKDAEDYYQRCSSYYFLEGIQTPTLIVNAVNDPFLAGKCFPTEELKNHPFVYLEMPEEGGHVGFMPRDSKAGDNYWSEDRAVGFVEKLI